MASITFSGQLDQAMNELAAEGNKILFIPHQSVGEVLPGAASELVVESDGTYSITLAYNTYSIYHYSDVTKRKTLVATDVVVSTDTLVTTIPDLIGSTVPTTADEVLSMQQYLKQAKDAADRAESAAIGSEIYANTSDGLADTVDGDYFAVVSSDEDGYLDLYLNDDGSAVYQKTYPSVSLLETIQDDLSGLSDEIDFNAEIFDGGDAGAGITVDSSDGNAYFEVKDQSTSALTVGTYSKKAIVLDSENNEIKTEDYSVKVGEDSHVDLGGVFNADDRQIIDLVADTTNALVVGSENEKIIAVDTKNESMSVGYELETAGISDTGEIVERNNQSFDELTESESSKIIGFGDYRLEFDSVNGQIKSTFEIVDNSQNPKPITVIDEDDEPSVINGVSSEYELSNRLYQGTPSITKSGSRFWVTWRADVNYSGEAPGNFFVVGYSDDGCQTVTETNIVTYVDNDNHQIVDPMLWTSPEGQVWLFWGAFGGGLDQDGMCGCWCSVLQNPEATGGFFSWSKPTRYRYIGDPRRIVGIDGKYYQCVDMWRSDADYPPLYPDTAGCTFIEFDYRDKKIKNLGRNTPNYNGSYGGFFETEVVQLSTGALMSTTRGAGSTGITRSFSYDKGLTWTEQEDYTTILGDVSASRIWLGHASSGRLMIVYNNSTNRTALTVAFSEDDGESYPYSFVIDAANSSYPIVTFDGDDIYIAYDHEREAEGAIKIAKVSESEVIAGTATVTINTVSELN